MLKALIFDADGALADTETTHHKAFNQAFSEFGLDWHWDEELYAKQIHISGSMERLLHYWRSQHPDMCELDCMALHDTLNRLHELKTAVYQDAANCGVVQLRKGALTMLSAAHEQGLQLAVITTTSKVNISNLLRRALGPDWRFFFTVISDASSVSNKKPHPEMYFQMLDALQLQADECLVFEDSFNGLRASRAAGLATVITPTKYTANHDFTGAICVIPDFSYIDLSSLKASHSAFLNHRCL
jgi:HAD superfamily hydrolase (TIGR01509 family)